MHGMNDRDFQKEHEDAMKTGVEELIDDEEDFTHFEIAIINKRNSALVCACRVRMGEIQFDKFFIVKEGMASRFVSEGTWFDKSAKKSSPFYSQLHGPKFPYLSESLQNSLIEYLYAVGVRPEIAMCVEYLSWNKEQRLYMAWLRDLYGYLFISQPKPKVEAKE